jgi:hypothetical protein
MLVNYISEIKNPYINLLRCIGYIFLLCKINLDFFDNKRPIVVLRSSYNRFTVPKSDYLRVDTYVKIPT